MPVYDYKCMKCKNVTQHVREVKTRNRMTKCPICGEKAPRIWSTSNVNTANDDAAWVRTCHTGFSKKDKTPAVLEYLKNPTRSTLNAAMKAKGIRHMDPAEDKFLDEKPWKANEDPVFMRKLHECDMSRRRIEVQN